MGYMEMRYGETSCGYQSLWLKEGCNILLATSGRLTDFAEIARGSNSQVHYLVLDVAHRMWDMGFKDEIFKMVRNLEIPGRNNRSMMIFSVTFPDEIQKMVFEYLVDGYLLLRKRYEIEGCKDVKQRF